MTADLLIRFLLICNFVHMNVVGGDIAGSPLSSILHWFEVLLRDEVSVVDLIRGDCFHIDFVKGSLVPLIDVSCYSLKPTISI